MCSRRAYKWKKVK
uniref:Uncharacterized protein n=1 Tax=Rhizophora mucronata TaxID=61149 RepID=A0A2P2MM04_RHIMU